MVIVTGIGTDFVPQLDTNEAQRRAIWQYAGSHPQTITPIQPDSLAYHQTPTNFRTGDAIKDLNGPRGFGIFENFGLATWAWSNRKWLLIGGGVLALLGAASIVRSL